METPAYREIGAGINKGPPASSMSNCSGYMNFGFDSCVFVLGLNQFRIFEIVSEISY